MQLNNLWRSRALAAIVMGAALLAQVRGSHASSADDTARILAGLTVQATSPLAPMMQQPAWRSHARYFDQAWDRLEARQLSKIRAWSAENIKDRSPTVFYMFSGPDVLYADAILGGAPVLIMAGLEPVGSVPSLDAVPPQSIGRTLGALQGSMNSVLSYSFFQTKIMAVDFAKSRLNGTAPVLFAFLARAGKTLRGATLVAVGKDGALAEGAADVAKGEVQGIKIEFTSGAEGLVQSLYYFSTDISNGGLEKSGFAAFLKARAPADSFVKSASYLMHNDHFSEIRSLLLDNSAVLVQDDSGIPARFFKSEWTLKPFGRYLGPIRLFSGRWQPELQALYKKGPAAPIPFGLGYRWRPNESNLLLAIKSGTKAASR